MPRGQKPKRETSNIVTNSIKTSKMVTSKKKKKTTKPFPKSGHAANVCPFQDLHNQQAPAICPDALDNFCRLPGLYIQTPMHCAHECIHTHHSPRRSPPPYSSFLWGSEPLATVDSAIFIQLNLSTGSAGPVTLCSWLSKSGVRTVSH